MLRGLIQLTFFGAIVVLALTWMERRPQANPGADRGALAAHLAAHRS